jgi:hypothetical protein
MYCACGSCLLMQTLKGRSPELRSLKHLMGDISVSLRNITKSKSPSLPVLGARGSCPRAQSEEALTRPMFKYCILLRYDGLLISYGRFGETWYFDLHGNERKVSCVGDMALLHSVGRRRIRHLVNNRYQYCSYISLNMGAAMYRVSIKSFPDYKHLLQENYVEYIHIYFFQNVTQEPSC